MLESRSILSRRALISLLPMACGGLMHSCARRRTGQIAVVPKTTAIDYWENLHAGAQNAAKPLGLRIFWNAPQSEANFSEQAFMVEDLIRRGVDGIVLAPSHSSVLASAVRHAKAEGIPLVVVDSPVMVDERDFVAYIGSDPERIGALAAMRAGAILQGKGRISVIGVSPTIEAAVLRERAFASAIRRRFPRIELDDTRYGLADHVRSREIAAEVLRTTPPVSAIFASDQFATRGALIALRGAADRRGARLIGVAQERDLISYLERSQIDALVVQDSYAMGQSAVEIMGRAFSGSYSGPRRIETGVEIVTREVLHTPRIQQLITRRD